jgi:hypothetical protein
LKRTLSLVIIAAVMSLAACQNPNSAPPGDYGTVSGKITSASGQPVAGVVVQVDSGPEGTSGADGNYVVTTVPATDQLSPAIVAVTSVPAGYGIPPPLNNVQVKAGTITPGVNFTLPPG